MLESFEKQVTKSVLIKPVVIILEVMVAFKL